MLEIALYFVAGMIATYVLLARSMRAKRARLEEEHAQRVRRDAKFERLWLEAVELLRDNGQLSDEQMERIMPSRKQRHDDTPPPILKKGEGFSDDRAEVEIARAEAGLPPADNLEGMFSDDIAAVKKARVKHGTAD